MADKKPVVLIIRDGWGVNPGGKKTAKKDGNAVLLAKTPFHDMLWKTYPLGLVSASGGDVGLPDGQMGNSEVGHLNLGAGRIVYQDLTRINKSIADGDMVKNKVLKDAFGKAKGGKVLHFVGLVSDGGVHSHQDQLIAMAKMARESGVEEIYVHAITDGRDTSPTAGAEYLSYVEDELAKYGARIATVVGRYYAMDRDKRWERTEIAWNAIVHGIGEKKDILASEAVAEMYQQEKTDEFLMPMIFYKHNTKRVNDGDVVVWFNFRADRARQLSEAFLTKPRFEGFKTGRRPQVHYVTLTQYDETYGVPVAYKPQNLKNVLGEVVAKAGKKQMRIAETEKYPHVTYFFNGGKEKPNKAEERFIVPSPKVATYDLQPEMSAPEVMDTVVKNLKDFDLVILNFANPDMVGHTGFVKAAIKACETIDLGVKLVVEETLRLGGKLIITADHGNCEYMINSDGSPNTAHTTNLVHAIYVGDDYKKVEVNDGILADIAPTLLDLMGVKPSAEMTGKSLLVKK
ncbi:MAG: 2,3-bisphosphoglycerate-independent phosphoglycerate mutase [Akkermansiaceae bacterium]